MSPLSTPPVVIGAGLTGMVISDSLSRSKIHHVLLGHPPSAAPRLGESLDGVGSRELIRLFPEFQHFFFQKKHIVGLFGEYVMGIYLEPPPKIHRIANLALGIKLDDHLLHVDRMGFDSALYEHIRASTYCTPMDMQVESLEYDAIHDKIEYIRLSNGENLAPRFVYDCTNHIRLLGKALDIPVQFTSDVQRVVFTHYQANSNDSKFDNGEQWQHATNLLMLCADRDFLDGAAWAIPLGSYVSLGVSMPFRDNPLEDGEAIELVLQAFARRGLDIRKLYPHNSKIVAIPRQQYFNHKRAYGANWVLAGTTFGQAWFPTSSGFGAALIAAALAPEFLKRPEIAGPWYENYMRRITDAHTLFDTLFTNSCENITRDELQTLVDGLVTNNLERVLRNEQLRNNRLRRALAKAATEFVYRSKAGRNWGRIMQVDLHEQMAYVFNQVWRTW